MKETAEWRVDIIAVRHVTGYLFLYEVRADFL
jgi:hypothetical protein